LAPAPLRTKICYKSYN